MLTYTPAVAVKTSAITKLVCPHCGEKVQRIALTKESRVEGLSFKCKRCGQYWSVKSTAPEN